MLRVAGTILALVGALAFVGCGDDSKAKGDKGVTLPDGGPGEGGVFPDYGLFPDTGPTEGGAGSTCTQIVSCVAACGQSDQACMNACVAAGSADAQAKFQTMLTCMNTAGTGSCATDCADPSSTACSQCIAQACAAEIQACQAGGTSTGANSGAICSQTNPTCPDANEICATAQGATSGMCLGKCTNQGDQCQVADSATMLSLCGLYYVEISGQQQNICAYVCENSGKTYSCPNATDYTCEVHNPQQPDLKVCKPK